MTGLSRPLRAFVATCGWSGARAIPLAGDAGTRRYHRLLRPNGSTTILMDASATPEPVTPFLHIATHLTALGLSAPRILAADDVQGFLLLEDFGDDLFPTVLAQQPVLRNSLYSGAIDVLVTLSGQPPPANLMMLDGVEMARIAAMVLEWYVPCTTGTPPPANDLLAIIGDLADSLIVQTPVLMLRDYHAGNLIWLPDRPGPAGVGLLDFQDAMIADPAYDLVSLLQDARRDVPPDLETAMIARYLSTTGRSSRTFGTAYALMGAQRALRILGIFARLAARDAKPRYLAHAPRVWQQLRRNLAHPALSKLAELCDALIPEPTPERLQRIRTGCPRPPMP